MLNKVCIWDLPETPDQSHSDTIAWNTFSVGNDQLSIPKYLEKHAERFRSKYLAFVYDFSHSKIEGKSILEHLEIGDEFSFWWMTKIAEKSPFKSPRIYDCLRVMVLEEIILDNKLSDVTLESSDADLAETIERLCLGLKVRFTWKKKSRHAPLSLRTFYELLPYPLQGILSLRHLIDQWKLRNSRQVKWFSGPDTVLMCSYFFNLKSTNGDDAFYSNQWGEFPAHLIECGKKLNWLQHYLPSPSIPNVHAALSKMKSLNKGQLNDEIHSFLDGFLSLRIIGRVLNKWFRKNILVWRLLNVSENFRIKNSAVWLWPLLRHDWKSSICGTDAVTSWLWIELFDAALAKLPNHPLGFYLWENQGWEAALLKAWHKYDHGVIIGVPHATICFWHLNNFEDARAYTENVNLSKPLPNYLAVNGPMAWNQLLAVGYPEFRMKKVEALRFAYLEPLILTIPGNRIDSSELVADQAKHILLLGDFTLAQTLKMLDCVRGAAEILGHEIKLTVKPHPVCDINHTNYPFIPFDITNDPIQSLVNKFDIAFVSNTSSAGLDAFLSGLSVAIYIDGDDFNHSPLKGISGISFVTNAQELSHFLYTPASYVEVPRVNEYFWLDSNLSRWTTLICEVKNL